MTLSSVGLEKEQKEKERKAKEKEKESKDYGLNGQMRMKTISGGKQVRENIPLHRANQQHQRQQNR